MLISQRLDQRVQRCWRHVEDPPGELREATGVLRRGPSPDVHAVLGTAKLLRGEATAGRNRPIPDADAVIASKGAGRQFQPAVVDSTSFAQSVDEGADVTQQSTAERIRAPLRSDDINDLVELVHANHDHALLL